MISFTIINEENKEEILDRLLVKMPEADGEYASEIIDSLLAYGECEYGVSIFDGCLLVRVFDEKYRFIYPVALYDGADESLAAYKLREYAVKEEIPLIYTDVPREALGNLIPLFRHLNIDVQDSDGECFTVKVISEASMFEEIPEIEYDGIRLDRLTEVDDSLYAELCKDEKTNEFWGYDYSLDNIDPPDSYFREMTENEFNRGVAMAFAVRVNGAFVGEATLYAFDLLGGCECSIRILPEYRRDGIATKALLALHLVGKRAGLISLCATVDARNEPSKKLCKKCFEKVSKTEDKYKFYSEL